RHRAEHESIFDSQTVDLPRATKHLGDGTGCLRHLKLLIQSLEDGDTTQLRFGTCLLSLPRKDSSRRDDGDVSLDCRARTLFEVVSGVCSVLRKELGIIARAEIYDVVGRFALQ